MAGHSEKNHNRRQRVNDFWALERRHKANRNHRCRYDRQRPESPSGQLAEGEGEDDP